KENPRFSDSDIVEFISKIGPQQNLAENLEPRLFSFVPSFDNMVKKVLEVMEFSEKEIILISRFSNELIINTMIKKSQSGIKVKVLADMNMVNSFFEAAGSKTKSDDKNKKERMDVVANPYYPSPISRKYINIPYCVLIVDKKHVGIELVDSHDSNKFKNA